MEFQGEYPAGFKIALNNEITEQVLILITYCTVQNVLLSEW
jgi:hypothetical protein